MGFAACLLDEGSSRIPKTHDLRPVCTGGPDRLADGDRDLTPREEERVGWEHLACSSDRNGYDWTAGLNCRSERPQTERE